MEYLVPNQTVCVGYTIYLFRGEENDKVKIYSYDVKKNLFSFKASLNLENTRSISCAKVSMY